MTLAQVANIICIGSGKGDDIRVDEVDVDVHVGGPVETGRGFVLHSSDYHAVDSTLAIDDGVSLTATIDILKAIAAGKGPDRAILALGYTVLFVWLWLLRMRTEIFDRRSRALMLAKGA